MCLYPQIFFLVYHCIGLAAEYPYRSLPSLSRKLPLFAGMLLSVITTLYYQYVTIIFHHRVWYRTVSLPVFAKIKVRASSSSLGYLCAKFCFFRSLHFCKFQMEVGITHQPPLVSEN